MASSTEQRRRRRHVIRAVLASIAVFGFGAAITTAAWTDSVFFQTRVQSGTVNLQGAVDYKDPANPGSVPDGLDWQEFPGPDAANMGDIKLFISPARDFVNLGPGEARSATIWVKSDGSLPVRLDSVNVSWNNSNFTVQPQVTLSALDRNGNVVAPIEGWTLRAGDWLTVTVTVTTPSNWPQENAGKGGDLILEFHGTTDGVT